MQSMYANRSAVTTTENGEVFLMFFMDVPQFDEEGKAVGTKREEEQTIVMTSGAYASFKEMLDSIKGGEEE